MTENSYDTDLLNLLEAHRIGYGKGWICRYSTSGRGIRLHESSDASAKPSVREAIREFIRAQVQAREGSRLAAEAFRRRLQSPDPFDRP